MKLMSLLLQRSAYVFLIISVGLISYFSFHALEGKHGLKARSELKWRVEKLEQKLAELKTIREELDRDVTFIRYDIDPDLLDENARRLLNLVSPDDIVIILEGSGS